jgi:hypothetical protein
VYGWLHILHKLFFPRIGAWTQQKTLAPKKMVGEGRGEEEGSTDEMYLNIHKQSFTSHFIWV